MLQLLGQAAQGFNDWRLCVMSSLPAPWLAALALALAASLVLSALALRRASLAGRGVLVALRLVAALLIGAILLEPGVELRSTVHERGRLAVLVDASASMAMADGDLTRWQRAAERWSDLAPGLRRLAESVDIELYRVAESALPVAGESALLQAPPNGQRSDLLAALAAIAPDAGKRPLAAVALISDGADNADLQSGDPERGRPVVEALRAPLWAVPVGDPKRFRDLAIEEVVADDFAFVRNEIEIEVAVSAHGIEAKSVPVTLRDGGQVIAVVNAAIDAARPTARASFRFTPAATGKKLLVAEVPVLAGEAVVENNQRAFALKVIRDRIRVLQVAGRPSWDERFLRVFLKANPSVDLISFFILRSASDQSGSSSDELSLIPFPTEELFTRELKTFDIVILQNFNYRPYQMGLYLQNVRDFVTEQGGGLAMIGGDLSFSEAGYGGTPIAEVLPVQLGSAPRQYRRAPYQLELTPIGRQHPILDLGRGEVGSVLGRLPPLSGLNLVAGVADGAQVLLTHPFERAGRDRAPVVAVREVGRGRSLAVLTDDTWYWSLPDVASGGRGVAHRQFWANALRWLIRDPALSRVRLESARRSYDPGAEAELRVRTVDAAYRPLAAARVTLQVVREQAGGDRTAAERSAITDADGEAALRIPDLAPGNYRAMASAVADDGSALGHDDDVFIVSAARPEQTAARPRPELLAALARMSNGALVSGAVEVEQLPRRDARVERISRAKRIPLWDNLWSVLALCAIAGSEWWLRRRWGFA
ncbi:MAG: hypothetical protein JXR83_22670 [Deltaproteobacteria bacterium]|nr:hypothetical protein [Deltaproteobacteria bacterium]